MKTSLVIILSHVILTNFALAQNGKIKIDVGEQYTGIAITIIENKTEIETVYADSAGKAEFKSILRGNYDLKFTTKEGFIIIKKITIAWNKILFIEPDLYNLPNEISYKKYLALKRK